MTIRFLCPLGHKLAVPDELAGKKGRCPECNQRVYIPHRASQHHDPIDPEAEEAPLAALAGEEAGEEAREADRAAAAWGSALEDPLLAQEGGSIGPEPILSDLASDAIAREPSNRGSPPPLPGAPLPSDPFDGNLGSPAASDFGSAPGGPEIQVPDLPPPALPFTEARVRTEETEGYVPDSGKVQTVYMLAIALAGFTVFAAAPALRHINLLEAPWWARVVLVLSAIQLAYIAWMVSLPDWSTVWIGMLVFAVVAAVYGVACGIIVVTPESEAINFLDLDGPGDDPDFRKRVAAWCFAMLLLGTILTYACGRFSGRWRKQYELAKAARKVTSGV